MFDPRIGILVMFEGDYRKVIVPIKNVTTFTNVTQKLMLGDDDVTSTYITNNPTYVGNTIWTGKIGDKASMPAGEYVLFLTCAYDGGKTRTWYIEIKVLPKDVSEWYNEDFFELDYQPVLDRTVLYEGDIAKLEALIPGIDFTSVSSTFRLAGDETDLESTYSSDISLVTGPRLLSSSIGSLTTVPAGRYAYFITGVWGDNKTTWLWVLDVLPRTGVS